MDYEIMMNGNIKIGMYAPEFEANSTMGNICLSDYKGKWIVLFSHPGDFTPVCTTEIIAFAKMNTYFEKMNASLIGLSVDSNSSHLAWLYDIYLKTGICIPFPIIADRNGVIARKYGMISNDVSNAETVRNVFIIDDKGVVRAVFVYPMTIGRCIPEILRTLQALQTAEENKAATPANWIPGNPVIVPSSNTFCELQKRMNNIEKNRNGMNWYLSFKKPMPENTIDNCRASTLDCKKDENKKDVGK